jgi:hypothetical protein
VLGEELSNTFSDEADAQAIDDSLEWLLARLSNLPQQVFCGFVSKSIERDQLLFGQQINVSDVFY